MGKTEEEEILKGKHHYKVVWEDKLPEPQTDEEPAELVENDSSPHPIHSHPESVFFIIGSIVFMLLVYLSFVNPNIFWIFLSLLVVGIGIISVKKKAPKHVHETHMKIDHPIKTGFEITLGMSLFFTLVLIVVAIIIALIAGTVLTSLWESISAAF